MENLDINKSSGPDISLFYITTIIIASYSKHTSYKIYQDHFETG